MYHEDKNEWENSALSTYKHTRFSRSDTRLLYGAKPFLQSSELAELLFWLNLLCLFDVDPLEETSFSSFLSTFSIFSYDSALIAIGLCTSLLESVNHDKRTGPFAGNFRGMTLRGYKQFSSVLSKHDSMVESDVPKQSLTNNVLPKSFKHCTGDWSSWTRSSLSSSFCLEEVNTS